MALASGATDGIRADSAAKESLGAASTLGSQTGALANEVIVPDAITANNEGNLESTPVYPGRMICIRPWEMRVATIVLVSGGASHAVSDVVTLAGVAGVGGAPQITVDTVSGGVITAFTLSRATAVQVRRGAMTSAPSPTDNPVAQNGTTGSGTGATFNVVWEPNFEIRYITADASLTLTVNEDWEVPPVSGDNWAVAYTLDDYATQTGLTLRAQSGVFEATRRIKVGDSTVGAGYAWLAINDGKQIELDNTETDPFLSEVNGVFTMGYLQGGASVNGGYIATSNSTTVAAPIAFEGLFFVHDLQIRSPRQPVNLLPTTTAGATYDADEKKFQHEAGLVVRKAKIFDAFMDGGNYSSRIQDITLQNGGTGGPSDYLITPGAVDISGVGSLRMNGATVVNMEGFRTNSAATGDDVTDNLLRNIRFIGTGPYIGIDANEIWHIVNPIWTLNLDDDAELDFLSTVANEVNAFLSLIVRPVTADGSVLSGVNGYVFEGLFVIGLEDNNTNTSQSSAYDPQELDATSELRWLEDNLAAGDVCYRSDVLVARYTSASSISANKEPRGALAWRGYVYGRVPGIIRITDPESFYASQGIDQSLTLLVDDAITELVQADALTNPTVTPTITKHGVGETDPRPMKALDYDAGTGGVPPSLGEPLTQGSATGVVVEVIGDGVEGTVLLESWNGVEFADNQNITGGTSAFDATTDTASFYAEFTWEVDGKGESMAILYDYLMAYMADDAATALALEMIEWGGDEVDATQFLFSGLTGYFTNRAKQQWKGIPSDSAADFTDDFNRTNEDVSADADWTKTNGGTAELRLLSNEIAPPSTSDRSSVVEVATGTFTPSEPHYQKVTLSVRPTSTTHSVGLVFAHNTVLEQALVLNCSSSTAEWRISNLDTDLDTNNLGSALATDIASVTAADGDEVLIVYFGNGVWKFYINGIYGLTLDNNVENFYADYATVGLFGHSDATNDGRLDDFECGNLLTDADFRGEGIWPHDRGAGDIAYFTSDDGTQFVPIATVTIEVNGVTQGTPCMIIAAETLGSVTAGDVLLQGFANSLGVASTTLIYEGAFGAGLDVDVKARNSGVAVAAIAEAPQSTFADETIEAADGASDDMNLLPVSPAVNDAYYFGHNEQFPRLKLWITDANGTGSTFAFEYWDGLAWTALSGVVDGTSNFENTLENIISWTVPGDWATTSVNGQGPLYYIRIRLTVVGSANQTRARQVNLDTTRYLPFPQSGVARRTITPSGLAATAAWTVDTIGKFTQE